jgi:DNA-binding transcriptional ArsR family regulator
MPQFGTLQPAFGVIPDPIRRAIIAKLAQGDCPIAEIASEFATTRPAAAEQLAVLRYSDLIAVEHRGCERINRFKPKSLHLAADRLDHFDKFWDDRLSALAVVAEQKERPTKTIYTKALRAHV